MKNLISRIIKIELHMFQNVPNVGGPASCQQDRETFDIMRASQLESWSKAVAESYLIDLEESEKNGRNLMTEKYARMMESTSPIEYVKIKHLLPPLNSEVLILIEKIVYILLEWEKELAEKFPNLLKRGRPIYSADDTNFVTSIETYLKGELATYSHRTLELYYQDVLKQKTENINGSEKILRNMVIRYGIESLEEADKKYKSWV